MKTIFKKSLALAVCAALCLTAFMGCLTVSATGSATAVISTVSVANGTTSTSLTVTISGSPNIAGARFDIVADATKATLGTPTVTTGASVEVGDVATNTKRFVVVADNVSTGLASIVVTLPYTNLTSTAGDITVEFGTTLEVAEVGETLMEVDSTNGKITVQAAHVHDFSGAWQFDATNHWKACPADDAIDSQAAHSWGEWATDTAATCIATGTKHRTCSVCGYVENGTIPIDSSNHNYVAGTPVAATCGAAGYTRYTCSRCDDYYDVEGDPATGYHTWNYTDNSNGTHDGVCTVCSAVVDDEACVYGEWTTTVAATCTTTGTKTRTCSKCGHVDTDTIPIDSSNHNYVAGTPVAATCGAAGYTRYTCSRCGDYYDVAGDPATGDHTWGAWVETTPATTTSTGVKTRTCSVCGAEDTDTIPMIEEETALVTIELYNTKSPYNLLDTVDFDDLSDALAVTYDYAMGYLGSSAGADPTVVLNSDVVLTKDAEVTSYTILSLGDYQIDTNGYNLKITGSGQVKANYELTFFDDNPLVVESVSNGVYTYKLSIQLRLDTKSLTLSDSIFINYTSRYSNTSGLTAEYGMVYYKASAPETIYTVQQEDLTPGSSRYTARTMGISAKDMGSEFVATFFAKVTIDAVDYFAYSNTVNYSIVQYVINMLPKANATQKELYVAMLNYGSAAQVYQSFDVENLANSILDDEDKVLPDGYESYLVSANVANDLRAYSQSQGYVGSASLETKDAINIKYNLKSKKAGKTYKLCVWTQSQFEALVGAETDPAVISDLLVLDNAGSVIEGTDASIILTGISAKRFANTYYTRLVEIDDSTNAEAYDWLWTYSPLQYCVNQIGSDKAEATLKTLCRTIAVYSAKARAYFSNYVINAD